MRQQMARWPQNDVRRNDGYTIVGHLWERTASGWKRKLLRKFRRSGLHDWTDLIYVDGDDPRFCMACLSGDVELDMGSPRDGPELFWDRCNDCGVRFRIVDGYE